MSTSAPSAAGAVLVTGSTMGHVLRMTGAASIGLIAVFAVDAINLFYVGLLGNPVFTAALGYSTTLLFFFLSICIGLSVATTALTSRAIGRGEAGRARELAGASLVIVTAVSAALSLLALPAVPTLLGWLGAQGATAELAATLTWISLPSVPLLGLGMCTSGLLRATGDARRAMYVTLGAALATVVLDPLLIFAMDLGVHGAAISTVLARVVMFAIGLHGVLRVHRMVARPRMPQLRLDLRPFMGIALPAILTQVATPVGNAYMTAALARFGDEAVAGWTVVQRLIPVAFGLLFALSGAIGPIVGQNFGARRFDRVRSSIVDSLKVTVVYVLAVWALLALTAPWVADVFRATPQAREVIMFFCFFVAGSFLFNGALFVANAAFNNLGYPMTSTLLNWGRSTLGVIPFVWLGQHWFGMLGALGGYGLGVVGFGAGGIWWCLRVIDRMQHRSLLPAAAG
jgi:putative MATE family efflux protein